MLSYHNTRYIKWGEIMSQFDEVIKRDGSLSLKWDFIKETCEEEDLLPMWVADMDFQAPKAVIDALQKRVDHGIFGYTITPPSTGDAITEWMSKRHQWNIKRSWLLYSNGVVPSLALTIQAFTKPGDAVLIQSPVYPPFFEMIKKNERRVINSPLHLNNGRLQIDFHDFENKLQQGVKLFFLCSPHNPGGRVWDKEELIQLAELCKKYDCLIIADEIHGDLVAPPYKHIPIASLNKSYEEFIVTCVAPSKTFNLAGLQASSIIVPNPKLRKELRAAQRRQGFSELNMFATFGMEAAYRHGEKWLDEVLQYIRANITLVKRFVQEEIPHVKVIEPEGSYLIWLDCRDIGLSDEELHKRLREGGKLVLEPGTKYGAGGEGFVRMNIGCPRTIVQEGLARMKKAIG